MAVKIEANAAKNRRSIVNIAAYKFVTLDDLDRRRRELAGRCRDLQLKGTILLAEEGINLFVAGRREAIDTLLAELRAEPDFHDLEVKESFSDRQPFNRMLVKIKREIIAFGVERIDPRRETSPRISPRELKRWLDEGRPVTLLDVRNDFEFEAGTFDDAVPIGISDFRNFPAAIGQLPDHYKQQPVVTFCTGGIRCEKAAPLLEQAGFAKVLQLDGGILKYFEECGGEHFRGDCFVFDKRVTLSPDLQETQTKMCFICQSLLSVDDCRSPKYVPGQSCPHCYKTPEQKLKALIAKRNADLRRAAEPLPGSVPYENQRPIRVPQRLDGLHVLDFLDAIHTHLSGDEWLAICNAGRLRIDGQPVRPDHRVSAGSRLIHHMPGTIEPAVNADIRVLYEDDAIVVVDKPAPLPMHPCGRFNRNTLGYLLDRVFAPLKLRPAHRLDANTSGVVVYSKTRSIASRLQPQFERGEVEKSYIAHACGQPNSETFCCRAPISPAPVETGARIVDETGLPSQTKFRVIERFDDGTSLIEARPISGRTNQIRVHLWHLGIPIVGDALYLPDEKLGRQQTLDIAAPPLRLHATRIEFAHPSSGRRMCFQSNRPSWGK